MPKSRKEQPSNWQQFLKSLTVTSKMEEGEHANLVWNLKNWRDDHKLLTLAKASCFMKVGSAPKIGLCFFLKPIEKSVVNGEQDAAAEVIHKWYSLWVEIKDASQSNNVAIKFEVQACGHEEAVFRLVAGENGLQELIDEFLDMGTYLPNQGRMDGRQKHGISKELKIAITATLFHLAEDVDGLQTTPTSSGHSGQGSCSGVGEGEATTSSLVRDLRVMYAAGVDNFSDLKLESNDNMTLSGHKWLLAARSPILRQMIDDAMAKDNFNGTIKFDDVNGKPLTAILHWMYTGEVHENAGKVMEELVEASIKFQLTDLLNILDEKLVTICDEENMYRLHKMAQKYGMTVANESIRAFIIKTLNDKEVEKLKK